MKKLSSVVLLVVIALVYFMFPEVFTDGEFTGKEVVRKAVDGELEVHYIDVGQSDATLLLEGDTTILIDTGDWGKNDVVEYLHILGIKDIDVLVGTHPHADHIGQMDKVIEDFNVGEVWMSGDVASSKVYERVAIAIDEHVDVYEEPRVGDVYDVGNLVVQILGPTEVTGDLNEGSVSMKVSYGEVDFVFTGDAEVKGEEAMLASGIDLSADILHLGHHGSDTSTTDEFLAAVSPDVAIYSAGEGNSYNHPSPSTVSKVEGKGIDLYGTDKDGTVKVRTDGNAYEVETSN